MKKIGILTHYYRTKNIGGLLQAYALLLLLQNNDNQVEQIAFVFKQHDRESQSLLRTLFPQHITTKKALKYPFSRLMNFLQKALLKKKVFIQNAVFSEFEQFIPHSAQVYDNTHIVQANEEYDIFITGSDQVFASYLLPFNSYYGEFTTPDKKVIAYAASSDRKQFPPLAEKLFIKKLSRINAISVREKTLKDYIERITPYKATVVLDPTFLLSPSEWLKIANPSPVPQKPYIFCYFLGSKSTWQRKMAQEYADKYGYEMLHLPYIMQSIRPADRFLKGQGRYDVGPREFIALIKNAQCVFTDSFHGLAFSINFGKNVYVFNRDDQSGPASMNARITDILDTFGLTDRHITDKNAILDNTPLDYTHVHEILAREQEFSMNWLLNALETV
ncbi:MAG: polysaccharide pyruvyl transferase family protein [Elusimicrobiaceae bacterium]|nr:polysaccharide pyruvyl transferase family protein [Elusimicrobiaceae bacterium]